jgi:hypothetical protein
VDVVLPEVTPLTLDLTYPEHPIKILDQKDCVTRRKTVKFFKVQWSNHSEEKATWKSLSYHSEGTCDCSLFLLGHFSFKSWDEILF